MEENKLYYKPELYEFHKGFRYEISNEILRGIMKITPPKEWYKQIYDGNKPYSLDFIEYMLSLYDDLLRVKYLDKEDILECGFLLDDEKYDEFIFKKNYLVLSYNLELHLISICIKDTASEVKPLAYTVPFKCLEKTVLNLCIKNISELKILLKQLYIECFVIKENE